MTADYVCISGFTVTGATGILRAGIYLNNNIEHCNISDNIASDNYCGIFLLGNNYNTISGNTASSNSYGIYLLTTTSNNTIYNNYFNNANNALDEGCNIWNISPTAGVNIIGGSWLGGNYWSDYDGIDATGDGLGDTMLPYNSNGNIIGGDMHPLLPVGFATRLSIEKSDDHDPVLPGGTINYSIIVSNNGYYNATDVTVTETYDVNTTYVSAIPAPSKGNDTWIFPLLNANETKGINISVSVNPSTPIGSVLQNIVKVSCAEEVTDSDIEVTTLFSRLQNCICGVICVNTTGWWRDGSAFCASDTPIQAAIDNAISGETICVKDGTYTENVDVNKRLTIRSENGAASTTVQALNSDDHVFEVTADYVTIRGFTVTGANGSWNAAGIYLNDSVDHCNISDNAATNNEYSIFLEFSSNNTITSNIALNNNCGILLSSSSSNTISDNTASNNDRGGIYMWESSNNELTSNIANSNNEYGIYLDHSSNNELTGNTVSNNELNGIYLDSSWWAPSSNNIIYNNYFNNTNNAWDDGNNVWNITPTLGGNIIGGSWQGGNYWSDYDGFDTNDDGLGDTLLPYNSNGDIITGGDLHPLAPAGIAPLLSIEKSCNPDYVLPGDTINYSIILTNTGYINATNVAVREKYAENVTFVSAVPAPSEGNDMWLYPTLNVSGIKKINISVTVNPSTPMGTYLHNRLVAI